MNYWFYKQTDKELKRDWGISAGWFMTSKLYPGYTSIKGKLAVQYMKSTDSNVSKVFATLNVSKTFAEFDSNYKKDL